MSSRKAQRKEEKRQLREEGRQAFRDGKHVQTNPYRNANALQWWEGYQNAKRELENQE